MAGGESTRRNPDFGSHCFMSASGLFVSISHSSGTDSVNCEWILPCYQMWLTSLHMLQATFKQWLYSCDSNLAELAS